MKSIDLNADIGEGIGNDAALLDIISSANIACGGHAGDDATMRQTLRLAHAKGVVCGAHPGFADKTNFGRLRLDLSKKELTNQIQKQYFRLITIAAEEGVPVCYLKLHGALANMAAEDVNLAKTAFKAVIEFTPRLPILALDNSAQVTAAEALGLPVICEAYADRAYTDQGLLASRTEPGAVLSHTDDAIRQCLSLAQQGTITTITGKTIKSDAQSICLHGDTEGAVDMAEAIRSALESAKIAVKPAI